MQIGIHMIDTEKKKPQSIDALGFVYLKPT